MRFEGETQKTALRDTDDHEALIVDSQRLAYDVRVSAKASLPEVIAQDHHRVPAWCATLLQRERATQRGVDSQGGEEVVGNELPEDLLRFSPGALRPQEKRPVPGAGDQAGKDPCGVAQITVFGKRKIGAPLGPDPAEPLEF